MPGKSYNNPQLEYERNRRQVAAETSRQKTEREKAKAAEENRKKAAGLKDQIASNNQSMKKLQEIITSAEKTKAGYVTSYNAAVRASKDPSSPGGTSQTPGELAGIASWQTLITGREQLIATSKSNIQDLKNKNDSVVKQLTQIANINLNSNFNASKNKITSSTTSNLSTKNSNISTDKPEEKEPVKPKGPYKYNLPLIKSARFSSSANAPLNTSLGDSSKYVSPPSHSNTDLYWNFTPGRGVLRVNKDWMKSILNSSEKEKGASGGLDFFEGGKVGSRKPDRQLYGFRFLYNPEKIQVVYTVNTDLHPGLIATGKDKFLPLTKSNSAITIDLVLNRVEDMKYKDNPSQAIRDGVYYGIGETDTLASDVQELLEKGTMYDLEYLFKVLNAPNATFNSAYNGKTADMGYIRPSILELHLGNRLRYPVRVIDLSLEHKIFDPRMVPIFSVVRMTFGRFIEFETTQPKPVDPVRAMMRAR